MGRVGCPIVINHHIGIAVVGYLFHYHEGREFLEQPFVKDQKTTIRQLVESLGGGAGIRRFARVKIGEE